MTTRPLESAASQSSVVADGYGIQITVQRGHLVIEDGVGRHRRMRRFPRIERDLRRIVVLAQTGAITLEAMRWCHDRGVAVSQLDPDGRLVTLSAAPGVDDARIRRTQALASGSEVGLVIARHLLNAKIAGQALVVRDVLHEPRLAGTVDRYRADLEQAASIARCAEIESQAANAYFGAWVGTVTVRFAQHDQDAVPEHWTVFAGRRSLIMRGRTPRVATDPVNALLNYLYALAEIEARTALVRLGLDPGLGIIHVDAKARDSLALDLLEVARPHVDRYVLELLASRHFQCRDFLETREGNCRLAPHLAHQLAPTTALWAWQLAAHAERLAHLLSPTARAATTPLTRANSRDAQPGQRRTGRRPRAAEPEPRPLSRTCRNCGAELTDWARQLCPRCWPVERKRLATERALRGQASRQEQRRRGADPAQSEEARAARVAALSKRKREQLEWDRRETPVEHGDFDRDVLPRLAGVPLSHIAAATGLSISACSRIRSGTLTPHIRHWGALRVRQ